MIYIYNGIEESSMGSTVWVGGTREHPNIQNTKMCSFFFLSFFLFLDAILLTKGSILVSSLLVVGVDSLIRWLSLPLMGNLTVKFFGIFQTALCYQIFFKLSCHWSSRK